MSTDDQLPARLVDPASSADPLTRRLLEGGNEERPPRARIEAWIDGAMSSIGAAGSLPPPTLGTPGRWFVAPKLALWVSGALLVGVAGAWAVVGQRSAPAALTVAVAAPASLGSQVVPVATDPPAPATTDLSRAPSAAPAHASAPRRSASTAAPSLEAELARLREARAHLSSGQPGAALSDVARYERDYPRGMLRPEAEVIAIDALVSSGRNAQALARAKVFLKVHGDSTQTERMRALVARLEAP
jgi:hypothetical protein